MGQSSTITPGGMKSDSRAAVGRSASNHSIPFLPMAPSHPAAGEGTKGAAGPKRSLDMPSRVFPSRLSSTRISVEGGKGPSTGAGRKDSPSRRRPSLMPVHVSSHCPSQLQQPPSPLRKASGAMPSINTSPMETDPQLEGPSPVGSDSQSANTLGGVMNREADSDSLVKVMHPGAGLDHAESAREAAGPAPDNARASRMSRARSQGWAAPPLDQSQDLSAHPSPTTSVSQARTGARTRGKDIGPQGK